MIKAFEQSKGMDSMTTRNIVFFDSRVVGYDTLVASLGADTEWYALSAEVDGVEQMRGILANYSGLDSIQVISHGSIGTLYLGGTVLNSDNLSSYQDQLQAIGSSLTETGDILLYGCDVAQGDVGTSFINSLAEITGADVAASSDATGDAALGGDWVLEAQTGRADAMSLAWSEDVGLLALNTAPAFRAPGSAGKAIIELGTLFDEGRSVALQSDGKILEGGISAGHFSLIRLNPDGSLDTSFDFDGKVIFSVGSGNDIDNSDVLQSDGKILLTGYSSGSSGNEDFSLIRLNPDGSLDTTFDGDGKVTIPVGSGSDWCNSAALQSDGKIVLAGTSEGDFSIVRLNANGGLDTSFDGDGKAIISVEAYFDVCNSVLLQSDGKIVLAGTSYVGFSLIRLNSDGSLDASFGSNGKAVIMVGTGGDHGQSVVLQSDGKIVVAGYSYVNGGSSDEFSLIRLNPDGSLDTSFDGDGKVIIPVGTGNDVGNSVVLQSDGKIVLTGYSDGSSGNSDFSLIRLNVDGSLDTSFDGDGKVIIPVGASNDRGRSVVLQSDEKIVLAGTSYDSNGYSDFSLIRLNSDGSLDTSFNGNSVLDATSIYTGSGPVVLDGDVQIDDAELQAANSFSGATLNLVRHAGANASDVFSAKSGGTLSALTSGSYFSIGTTTIGLVVSNANGVLQLGFNSNATQALVSSAMQQIAYANTASIPSAFAQIDWAFSDGNTGAQGDGGAVSVTDSTVVNIAARNVTPVVSHALADISVVPNLFFRYAIPANAFSDANEGDLLNYGIGMNDGTALPIWLKFDTATKAFSGNPGTPGVFDLRTFDIKVTATDHVGASTSDVFRLTLNSAPLATNLSAPETSSEDTSLHLTDIVVTDVDSANITATLSLSNAAAGALSTATSGTVISTYDTGTGVWSAAGALADVNTLLAGVTFTPTLNFNADFSITTSVSDGVAPAITGSKSFTGTAVNDTPTLSTMASAVATVNEDTQTTITLADLKAQGDEADVDGTVAAFVVKAVSSGTLLIGTSAGTASAWAAGTNDSIDATNNVYWTGAANANGTLNAFTVVATDNAALQSGTAVQVQVAVTAVNDAPVATNDSTSTDEDQALSANLPTATDVENNSLTYAKASDPAHGSVTIAANGSYTYTPEGNYSGADSFTYKANDGTLDSNTGAVTITVNAVNDAPTLAAPAPASYIDTAADDTFIAATGMLVGSDVDSTTLTYGISGGTATSGVSSKTGLYGTISVVTSSGAYTFTPSDAVIEGLKTDATDSFTVSVSDGSLTATKNYTVNISGANDPTTAITGQTTGTVAEDGTLNAAGTLSISDRDAADTSFLARSVSRTYGYFNIGRSGDWNYSLNNGTAIVQNLVAGQHVTDSFTVTTTGGLTQDVTIQIDGAGNSAPTFTVGDGKVTTAVGTSNANGQSITIQSNGKILVAGSAHDGAYFHFALVRYNTDGSLDITFDGDGKVTTAIGTSSDSGQSVTLQSDGKILVTGSAYNASGNSDFALVRYNTDGSLDTTFDGDGKLTTAIGTSYDSGYSGTLQSDGKILVAGFASNGSNTDFALVRYNTDGSLDTTFDGDGKVNTAIGMGFDYGQSVTLQSDGKILLAGSASNGIANDDFALVRYNTDGSLDTTFDGDGKVTTAIGTSHDVGYSLTVQSDGKILVAGYAYNGSKADFALVRYNTDGSLDATFDGDGKVTTAIGTGTDQAYSVTVQSDGKILVAGTTYNASGNGDFALARYNTDGSLDTTFDGDGKLTTAIGTSSDSGQSVTLQSDGKILVTGSAYSASGNTDFALVRYNTDGSLDNTFPSPKNTLDNNPTVSEQSTVVLDTNVHILDADLVATGNYSGATLTLSRHAGANTQDVFSATSGGTLSVLTAGAYFAVESVTIGRVTANSTGTLTLTFNANATQTLVDKAMQQIAYTNTSDAPPATAQIDWTFSDGNTGAQGDGGALSTTGSTTVNITPVNDSPRLTSYLADKTVLTGSAFNFTIPQNAFTDLDGETLSYGYAMSDGTGLPPWLSFNAATRTFSGTPDLIDVGSFNVRVTAKDAANASASDVFVLTVHANKLPTGSVSISGMLEQGQILTASNTLADVDGLGEISYQWQASGADISGASGSTYTLTQAEVGKTIALTASYTDGYGTAESVKSTATSAVANVDDEAMGTLGVSGVAQEGGTLTTSLSNVVDADGTTGKAWQWQISDDGSTFWSDITDATAASYAITSDQSQVGKYLRVIATTTDVLGGETTFTGNSSTQIANVDDEASGTLSITGTAEEGGTLTNNLTGASDPDGATTTAYRWQELVSSNWSDLSGAMAATLTIPGDQSFVGKQVRLVATTTDVLGGTTEFIGDANTIANIDDEASGTQSITGTAEEGGTLTASLSNVVDADGTTSTAWQWQISDDVSTFWSNITDTTSVSYAIASDQSRVGKYLRVVATTTDVLGGTTEFIGDANTITNIDDAASGTLAISGKVMEGATISANTSNLSDVDGGIASMAYQWQINTAGGWSDISGATTSSLSLPSDQSYLDSQIRLSALSTDAYGGTTSFTSAAQTVVKVSLGTTIDLMAYSWKAHTLLDGVAINGGAYSGATNASGALSFADVTEPSLALTATRAIPTAEVAATGSAVNLQDAIAILKMIVGLDVNGAGKALSPYQALAADFDGSGAVGLTDAIGVLKHVVGLSAPDPIWHFANESDLAVPAITPAGSVALPAINVLLDTASPVHVGLVGYLSGDVDGSYAGASGAVSLDARYFTALIEVHSELNPSQFGIYG